MSKIMSFNQEGYISGHKKLKKHDDGCCFSLALAWLYATSKYKMNGDYFEKNKVQSRVTRWQKWHVKELKKSLLSQTDKLYFDDNDKLILSSGSAFAKNNIRLYNTVIAEQVKKWGHKRNLNLASSKTNFFTGNIDSAFTTSLFKEAIGSQTAPLYGLIIINGVLGVHAMGYSLTNDLDTIRFFDSNKGEFTFQRKNEFSDFINEYMSAVYPRLGDSWLVLKMNKTDKKHFFSF